MAPDVTYMFRHALLRDAAYDSLLHERRRHWHERIGSTLEAASSTEGLRSPELVATHYSRARLPGRSIPLWLAAAQRAARASANEEAVRHCRAGLTDLEAVGDAAQRREMELELQLQLARTLIATHGYASPAGGEAYRRAEALTVEVGQVTPNVRLSVLRGLATHAIFAGDYPGATRFAEEAVRMAEGFGNPVMAARAGLTLAQIRFFTGSQASAHSLHERALRSLRSDAPEERRSAPIDLEVHTLSLDGLCLTLMGALDRGLAQARQAAAMAEERLEWFSAAEAFIHLGIIHQWRREPRETLEATRRAIEISEQHHFPHWHAQSRVFHSWARAVLFGDAFDAEHCRQAVDDWSRLGLRCSLACWTDVHADALAALGRLDEALDVNGRALSLATGLGESLSVCLATSTRTRLELARTAPDAAACEALLSGSIERAQSLDMHWVALNDALALARLLVASDRGAEAREALAPIYGLFTEGLGLPALRQAKALLDGLR